MLALPSATRYCASARIVAPARVLKSTLCHFRNIGPVLLRPTRRSETATRLHSLAASASSQYTMESPPSSRPRYADVCPLPFHTSSCDPFDGTDVGINLTDPVYAGRYYGKQAHTPDLDAVIARAQAVGCDKFMVTGSNLEESERAVEIAKQYPGSCYATVGIHPCSSSIFGPAPESTKDSAPAQNTSDRNQINGTLSKESNPNTSSTNAPLPYQPYTPETLPPLEPTPSETSILNQLKSLLTTHRASITALGELGLDYDRLPLCPRVLQLRSFRLQLRLAVSTPDPPPLFLHSRAAHTDFMACLAPHLSMLPRRGLVHSFTGTVAEMHECVAAGFHIGVNGCSLKTEENLAVVKEIPLDRLQLETDGPWCEIRPSHAGSKYLPAAAAAPSAGKGAANAADTESTGAASAENGPPPLPPAVKKEKWRREAMVKGRNEPCTIPRVAWVVAAVKDVPVQDVISAAWQNSIAMFGLGEANHVK